MGNELAPIPAEGQLLIYQDGELKVQVRVDGQTVWLTQRLMAELYQVTVPTVNEHLENIYTEGELDPTATIRKFRIVQTEGARRVACRVEHYNLEVILAVGYRVRSARGTAMKRNTVNPCWRRRRQVRIGTSGWAYFPAGATEENKPGPRGRIKGAE